jgi:hypothetical protein
MQKQSETKYYINKDFIVTDKSNYCAFIYSRTNIPILSKFFVHENNLLAKFKLLAPNDFNIYKMRSMKRDPLC